MRKGDLDAAHVDDGFSESHHQPVGLVLERLDVRVKLYHRGEATPALVNGAVGESLGLGVNDLNALFGIRPDGPTFLIPIEK